MTSTKSNGQGPMPNTNHRDLKARVMEYLDKHIGQRVYLHTIASDLGDDSRRVQQAMNRIMKDDSFPLRSKVQGQAWEVLRTDKTDNNDQKTKKEDKILFEQVRELKSGAVLLEREDGVLFKAIELDFDNL